MDTTRQQPLLPPNTVGVLTNWPTKIWTHPFAQFAQSGLSLVTRNASPLLEEQTRQVPLLLLINRPTLCVTRFRLTLWFNTPRSLGRVGRSFLAYRCLLLVEGSWAAPRTGSMPTGYELVPGWIVPRKAQGFATWLSRVTLSSVFEHFVFPGLRRNYTIHPPARGPHTIPGCLRTYFPETGRLGVPLTIDSVTL